MVCLYGEFEGFTPLYKPPREFGNYSGLRDTKKRKTDLDQKLKNDNIDTAQKRHANHFPRRGKILRVSDSAFFVLTTARDF